MTANNNQSELPFLISELREEEALEQIENRVKKGEDPLVIASECQNGIRKVGELYEKGIYYLSGLIMAGEIMHEAGEIIFPLIKSRVSGNESGRILIGTIQGDIHYIGKDIVKVLLRCFGFTVTDIGVDIPPEEFLAKAKETKPHIVGISCLLHSSYTAMRSAVELIRTKIKTNTSFIIGGLVDEQTRIFTGADAFANDAMVGVRLCQKLIKDHDITS